MAVKYFRELFSKAVLDRFRVYENLDRVEDRVKDLRSGKQIAYSDLLKIADDSLWPFSKFWAWPTKDQIEEGLKTTEGLLSFERIEDESYEKEMITKLDSILKNIALVSILLRFVYPERYGIYSPPVLHISKTERGKSEVEDYINYLNNLRMIFSITEIRERYGVDRIADVDMLLLSVSQLGDQYLDEFNSIFIRNYHPPHTYLIEISEEFEKSIQKYDKLQKGRVLEAIFFLGKLPSFAVGDTIKPLKNDNRGRWRYRIGDYRLLYLPDEEQKVVKLLKYGPRKDIYRELA